MKISLIAVLDQANGIGKDNKLLCHLPADLRRFKQLTTGHTVVMGRKTFESLPNGPLPNRKNIIITSDKNYFRENCIILHSAKEVFQTCQNEDIVFIIGGGIVYNSFIKYAELLYITKIHHTFDADTFFPEFNEVDWQEGLKTDHFKDEKNGFAYSFIDYARKK